MSFTGPVLFVLPGAIRSVWLAQSWYQFRLEAPADIACLDWRSTSFQWIFLDQEDSQENQLS